jgi:hypothetical protein
MDYDSGYLNTTAGFLSESNYGSYHSSFRTNRKSIDSMKFQIETRPERSSRGVSLEPSQSLIEVKDDSIDAMDGEDLDEQVESLGKSIVPRSNNGRSVGNFDKMYLDLGQFPKKNTQNPLILRRQYTKAKAELVRKDEIVRQLSHKISVRKSEKREAKLKCCRYIQAAQKQRVTENALKEALELSNLLIEKVKTMDAESCVSTPRFDSPDPAKHYRVESYGNFSYFLEHTTK